ncbi:MAG: LacI family transcriptional regulator [Marinilabiliales bacterium]|nr:MAG: LacI family transcriptional regulator [Marinilabiliales bacterium]
MRITIKDIARRLNVHHSTVSRALRMDPRIKHETGEMIRSYAAQEGYHINLNALKLRGSLRNMIALIVPNINHRFFSNIINYLSDLANENNYVLSIYQSNENFDRECSLIEKLIQQDVAGVIASVSDKTRSGEHFRALNRVRIPLVFFDRVLYDADASRVTANNREIVESLVSELAGSGRKKIAHVSGPDHINVFGDRNLGYKNGVKKNGAGYFKQVIIEEEFNLESGRKAAMEIFSAEIIPDAVISTSFFLSMGIISHLGEKNLKIPDDVVVAGFGDKLFNSLLHPEIISVEQPEEEMASAAFQLLVDQMEFGGYPVNYDYKNIELKSRII